MFLTVDGFSSRQLTAMFIAFLLAVVLFPVGARAAAALLNTVITDPGGTNKAHVDASGNLQVGGGVNVTNTPNVTVVNTPKVQTAIPAGAFSVELPAGDGVVSGPDPAGTSFAITSVTFTNNMGSSITGDLVADYGTTSDCRIFTSGSPAEVAGPRALIPPGATVHLSFPQPFVMKAVAVAGAASCLVQPDGNPLSTTVVGYTF